MKTFGYIRVSTTEQNIDRQVIALREAGVADDMMYIDHWSGKDFDRPEYQRMLKALEPGDLLIILSIDRMGRKYREVLAEWRWLIEEAKIEIKVLDMPFLDTRQSQDLASNLISDIMLQLQSYVAETERNYLLERQKQGIAAAKANGVKFGRPAKEIPEEFYDLKEQWEQKLISAREAAVQLNITHVTFLRWVRKH